MFLVYIRRHPLCRGALPEVSLLSTGGGEQSLLYYDKERILK
jgi:hypothetical protein